MEIKKVTKLVTISIPLIIAIILIYDAVAIMMGGTEASISSLIINASYKMPFMVLMIGYFNGLLHGHLFWRMKPNKDTIESGIDQLEEKK